LANHFSTQFLPPQRLEKSSMSDLPHCHALGNEGVGNRSRQTIDPCRLSIVIPTHNRPDLLRKCLESVVRHAPGGTEIIVIDDASLHGTAVDLPCERHLTARFLRLLRRSGFCQAVNAGIQAARSPIVELLNDDTEVTAGWAEAALACFTDPSVAAVAPLVLQFPAEPSRPLRIDSAGDRYYLGGVAGKRGHNQLLTTDFLKPCQVFGASASSAFYRREALVQVGGFPAKFGAYFEDVDVAFRLNRAGFRIVYQPASRVWHHGGGSYGPPSRRLLEQQSRNEERVFWRNVPAQTWAQALPRHLAVLAGKAWRRWQEGRLVPFLCGRLQVLAEIPELLRHRRLLLRFGPALNLRAWQIEAFFGEPGQREAKAERN
jgi:GT2 family glycosyltransferase